ncbi:MAG: ATP-binding protein [Lachnospiraceae bacterium]|nr:ATP-binding protein [Lachnospiraceae bacterium]
MAQTRATELLQMQDAFSPYPLHTQEEIANFYYETAEARTGDKYSDFVESMVIQVLDSGNSALHKLFIGHAGSGKTTELFRLYQRLKEENYFVCFGRCDIDLDSGDVEYTEVLFYILDLLIHKAQEKSIYIKESVLDDIIAYWTSIQEIDISAYQQKELDVEGGFKAGIKLMSVLEIMAGIKGILKSSEETKRQIRQCINPRSSELMSRIKEVIDNLEEELQRKNYPKLPFIILDGLDKIPLEQARKIFKENGSKFSELPIHLLVTFPIALTYTEEYRNIQIWLPNPEKLPMIKLKNWVNDHYELEYTEGIEVMRKIVEKRADLSLFEENVLDLLICQTGGYIRDLFRCIGKAAIRARVRRVNTISMEDAQLALNTLESDINGCYSSDLIPAMKDIYMGHKHVNSSEEITKLMQVGAVLEYNGTRWCDLHPLVEKWLLEHQKFGEN